MVAIIVVVTDCSRPPVAIPSALTTVDILPPTYLPLSSPDNALRLLTSNLHLPTIIRPCPLYHTWNDGLSNETDMHAYV